MARMGSDRRKRVVVKTYGAWTFLGLLSPLLTALFIARVRPQGRLTYDDPAMLRDAELMAQLGYEVVGYQRYELPLFGIDYRTVTYQLMD